VKPGDVVGRRYRLVERLGRGGMGEVWRAYDPNLRRYVAVKVLWDPQPSDKMVKRFRREAALAAGLKHRGITVVHDFGELGGTMFIVMELLHGSDLASLLEEHPDGLPVERAVDYGLQLAEALGYAHGKGIIHRDLKPGNLFIENPRQLKICDFGIARDENAAPDERTTETTETEGLLGTPAYMAPERWRGERATARSDLYAVGCVLYAMLTGGPPFQARTMHALIEQHLVDVPVPPGDLITGVPAALDELTLALLAKDPRNRPARAADVAGALRNVRQDLSRPGDTREEATDSADPASAAGDEGKQPKPGPLAPRRRATIAAIASAALVLAAVAGWRYGFPATPSYVTDGSVIFNPMYGPVESAIAAENAKVRQQHPDGYVSVALLTPLTPTGTVGDVSPQRMLNELRAAYVAQLAINANPNAPGVQLLLANEGTSNEGTANEGLADQSVAQLRALVAAPDNLVAVSGMGISITATENAASALATSGLAMFSAVTTGDEFYSGQYAGYYQLVPDVGEQVTALSQVVRFPGKAVLYFATINDDRYVTDLKNDFRSVFGDRIDQTRLFTPQNTGDFAQFAGDVCSQSAGQVPDILYAGRLSVLTSLISQLQTAPACAGKNITIVTGSDANDLRLSVTKTPPGGGQVSVIYADIEDRSTITPAFRNQYARAMRTLDPGHAGLKDPWTLATYDAIVAAGTAIDGTGERTPSAAGVLTQASLITTSLAGNEPDGATGPFAFDDSIPGCLGRLANPDIPVYQDSAGMQPVILNSVQLRQTSSACMPPVSP
jgi:Protein kinase domain